jgi:hypothetical protein
MKRPKEPIEPRAPYKPQKPEKQLAQNRPITSVVLDKYTPFSLKELGELLCSGIGVDPNTCIFELELEQARVYYDEAIQNIVATVFLRDGINDPEYDRKLANYEKMMSKYKADYDKYKKAKKAYKVKLVEFEAEMAKYEIEQLETRLARLKGSTK